MNDDDLDALAAEYVLGTLASDERAHAEALIAIDPGFVEIVRQWERRLGELNVMVEAVEPPAEIWGKIKAEIATVATGDEVRLAPTEPTPPISAKTETETKAEAKSESEESALLGALAASLSLPEGPAAGEAEARSEAKSAAGLALPAAGAAGAAQNRTQRRGVLSDAPCAELAASGGGQRRARGRACGSYCGDTG